MDVLRAKKQRNKNADVNTNIQQSHFPHLGRKKKRNAKVEEKKKKKEEKKEEREDGRKGKIQAHIG